MTTDTIAEARAWLEAACVEIEADLALALDEAELGPPRLAEAMRYALLGGGKRIRPALCRLVGGVMGAPEDDLVRASVALECIHTYSLVHDDLPCMDDDDLRRGRATVHVVYDEATAVLVGDALQSFAFELLAGAKHGAASVAVLARAAGAGGMVGGQVLDLASEGHELRAPAVEVVHRSKTAALLGAATELGAVAAGAPESKRRDARSFGRALGMCFQAVDDVLDVTGDAEAIGKTPGKDAEARKGTLVAALGLEGARQRAGDHAREAKALARALSLGAPGEGLVDLLLERTS